MHVYRQTCLLLWWKFKLFIYHNLWTIASLVISFQWVNQVHSISEGESDRQVSVTWCRTNITRNFSWKAPVYSLTFTSCNNINWQKIYTHEICVCVIIYITTHSKVVCWQCGRESSIYGADYMVFLCLQRVIMPLIIHTQVQPHFIVNWRVRSLTN